MWCEVKENGRAASGEGRSQKAGGGRRSRQGGNVTPISDLLGMGRALCIAWAGYVGGGKRGSGSSGYRPPTREDA